MKTEELTTLDAEELEGKLKDARRELYELRFKLAVGQLDNHRQIRQVRKDIAQILTIVHQRRWEGWEDVAEAPVGARLASPSSAETDVADVGARLVSPSSAETDVADAGASPAAVEVADPDAVDSPEAVEDAGGRLASPSEPEAPARAPRKSRARKADREENE
jgi:large subunit ribosomal protein L29